MVAEGTRIMTGDGTYFARCERCAAIEFDRVDLQHIYIDGSKFEANANKYTWVWKKATEKFRYKLYEKSLRRLRKSTQKSHGVEYRFQLILSMYQII